MEEMKRVWGEMEEGFGGDRSGAQKGGVGREDHDGREGLEAQLTVLFFVNHSNHKYNKLELLSKPSVTRKCMGVCL